MIKIKSIFCITSFIIILSYAFADDIVYLKSGQKIEGKITETTDWYVRVADKEGQGQYNLRLDDIERIKLDRESLKTEESNLKLADKLMISSYRTKESKILLDQETFELKKDQELVETTKIKDALLMESIIKSIIKDIDITIEKLKALLNKEPWYFNHPIHKAFFENFYLTHKDYKKKFKNCTEDTIRGLQLTKEGYNQLLEGNSQEQIRLMEEGRSIIDEAQQKARKLDEEYYSQ